MSLLAYPLAAMAGGLVGSIAHEATHVVLALALGDLEGVGWQGGLTGGPYVDFRTDDWLASEIIRKTPLGLGLGGAISVAASFEGVSLSWLFLAGVVAGLLWASPEDLSRARSTAAVDAD